MRKRIYIKLGHFAVQYKWTEHCKTTLMEKIKIIKKTHYHTLKKKKKKRERERKGNYLGICTKTPKDQTIGIKIIS